MRQMASICSQNRRATKCRLTCGNFSVARRNGFAESMLGICWIKQNGWDGMYFVVASMLCLRGNCYIDNTELAGCLGLS